MDIIRGGLPPLDPAQLAYVDQELYQTFRATMDPKQFGFWLPILPETVFYNHNSGILQSTDENF